MFSIPPATTISASPVNSSAAARFTALSPDPQTIFTVIAGTSFGIPAWIDAWRAGFWPWPACKTQPISTSETCSGFTPARFSASAIAMLPSFSAGMPERLPPNLPTAVRTAERMTISFI